MFGFIRNPPALELALLLYLVGRIEDMANDFSNLQSAIDDVAAQVEAVADAIANPAVDNNDQEVIDELTGRLNAAADALRAATEAENAEDAGPQPTPEEPVQ